jgi:hypothetical protein
LETTTAERIPEINNWELETGNPKPAPGPARLAAGLFAGEEEVMTGRSD